MAKKLVSAELIEAAVSHAQWLLSSDPALAKEWRDMVQTSAVSKRDGLVKLETDYDWAVALLIHFAGGKRSLPRETPD